MRKANFPSLLGLAVGLLALGGLIGATVVLTGTALADEPAVDAGKIARGHSLYRQYCRTCHGDQGKGDGPTAEYLRVAPADLTQLAKNNGGTFDFEAVAQRVDGREMTGHGSPDMPVWGDAFQKTEDGDEEAVREKIELVIHFVRSIQE